MLLAAACAAASDEGGAFDSAPSASQVREDSTSGAAGRSPAPTDSGASSEGGATASTIDRKIIQNASLSLQVRDVSPAYEQVSNLATAHGGFVSTSRLSSDRDGAQIATLTLKVPADRYDAVMNELRRLAVKVETEQSSSNDVTEEYTDLQSRLRNLEATEAQYLELMKNTNTINEVLSVQDRLNSVRGDIERIKGRINLLDRLSDLATITVTLRPVSAALNAGGPDNLLTAASEAWQASLAVLRVVLTALVQVVVFGWWILPPLALLVYLLRRRRPRVRPAAPEAPSA
jgi:hypothetical protein